MKTQCGGDDIEIQKAVLIYYVVASDVCLRYDLLFNVV